MTSDCRINNIYNQIAMESQRNPLIGGLSYSIKKASDIIRGPYVRGQAMFSAVSDLIRSANSEVLICFYKFQNDSDSGLAIIQAICDLKVKAEQEGRKIKVKIALNNKKGFSSYVSGNGRRSPIDLQRLLSLNSEHFDVQVANHKHYGFNSSHSKLVVCDGKSAAVMTGDPSFANGFNDAENWVDFATVCHDAALVSGCRRQFVNLWNTDNVHLKHRGKKEKLVNPKYQSGDNPAQMKKALFFSKNPAASPFIKHRAPYKTALLSLLNDAHSSVKIMLNNINDREILNALLRCAARGVHVELLVGRYHGESAEKLPFAGGTNLDSVNYLLANSCASMRNHLDIRWACHPDGTLVQNVAANTVHGKAAIVDESHVLTGSSLMDKQSSRSGESDVLFKSKSLARQFMNEAFTPSFSIARTVNLLPENRPLTRSRIRQLLAVAATPESLTEVVRAYIYRREYEDDNLGFRSFLSLFIDQSKYGRKVKIDDAKLLLQSLDNPNVETSPLATDGLLGEIAAKVETVIRKIRTAP